MIYVNPCVPGLLKRFATNSMLTSNGFDEKATNTDGEMTLVNSYLSKKNENSFDIRYVKTQRIPAESRDCQGASKVLSVAKCTMGQDGSP